jgi:serine/threonine-protein kinase
VFATNLGTGLSVVPAAGGTPQPLTTLDSKKGETSHRWPQFVPSLQAVVFNPSGTHLALYVLRTGERRDLIQEGASPHYAPTGQLIYAQAGTLMAVPFDPQRLAVTGSSMPIVEGVTQSANLPVAQYSISDTGALVYVPGGIQRAQRRLVWVDRKGAEQPLAGPPHAYSFPRVSPDGRRVVVVTDGKVWIYDLGRETLTPLTSEGGGSNPIWTPDGRRVVFFMGAPHQNLFWQAADGSDKPERLTTNEYPQVPGSWSPDGQVLAFFENNPTTHLDLWILRLSDRKPQPFLRTTFNESVPWFSPDGRWLAYVSDESGRYEVYVQPYPGPGAKSQVSTEGGTEPAWNPNGRELFYRTGSKMMAVDVTTQASFSAGKPRMLFEGPYVPTGVTHPNYDVSPDGKRFLMVKESEQAQAAPTQINVVLNWFEELKQKVPTGRK